MSKDHAKAKRIYRANKRKAGYVEKHIWVKPDNWQEIQDAIRKLNQP